MQINDTIKKLSYKTIISEKRPCKMFYNLFFWHKLTLISCKHKNVLKRKIQAYTGICVNKAWYTGYTDYKRYTVLFPIICGYFILCLIYLLITCIRPPCITYWACQVWCFPFCYWVSCSQLAYLIQLRYRYLSALYPCLTLCA